jgi:putative ABC transport system substrate-binding protein
VPVRRIGVAIMFTVALALAPRFGEAQPAGGFRRIGFLSPSSAEAARGFVEEEFQRGLRERGYVEGQSLHVEYRWAEGKADAFLRSSPT